MTSKPLISIVIPLFNAEDYIVETLQSVMNQTYTYWEILIVDDCSTDSSIRVIEEFVNDKRVKIIHSEKNFGGPAKPRNIGVAQANGEYIAFLDADDLWSSDKLETQIDIMLSNNLNFSSTSSLFIDDKSRNISDKYTFLSFLKRHESKNSVCDLIKNKFIATSSVLVKKNVLVDFSEDKDLVSVEDLYQWIALLDNEKVNYEYIDNQLLQYRVLFSSISNRGMKYKQSSKANLAILQFIVRNNKFEYVPCFYMHILKLSFIDFVKKILRK